MTLPELTNEDLVGETLEPQTRWICNKMVPYSSHLIIVKEVDSDGDKIKVLCQLEGDSTSKRVIIERRILNCFWQIAEAAPHY